MLKNYNRELFDKEWYEESKPQLIRSFEGFKPRSSYLSNKDGLEQANREALSSEEQPNIVGYTTSLCPNKTEGIEDFDEVFKNNSQYLAMCEKFTKIEDYVDQYVESAKTTFITFSTNVTSATLGVQHLHPLMNGNRCDVWSFCVPLYIDPECKDNPKFCYTNDRDGLYPTRWYVDYDRIKKQNFNYASFNVPLSDRVFNVRFDGTRSPHYIDYTNHVFAWFVFDGITYKHQELQPKGTEFIAELL